MNFDRETDGGFSTFRVSMRLYRLPASKFIGYFIGTLANGSETVKRTPPEEAARASFKIR
jgi:hypothetical protein